MCCSDPNNCVRSGCIDVPPFPEWDFCAPVPAPRADPHRLQPHFPNVHVSTSTTTVRHARLSSHARASKPGTGPPRGSTPVLSISGRKLWEDFARSRSPVRSRRTKVLRVDPVRLSGVSIAGRVGVVTGERGFGGAAGGWERGAMRPAGL